MKCKNYKTRTKTIKGKRTIYNYCTVLKQEINYENCRNCAKKEFKIPKSTIFEKNSAFQEKISPRNTKNSRIRQKSYKLAKLERNRTSLFTDDLNKCIVCGSEQQITIHEIFAGRNRKNSMIYKLVIPLCLFCHEKYQENKDFNNKWHKLGQEKFEKVYKDLNFEKIFFRNYK